MILKKNKFTEEYLTFIGLFDVRWKVYNIFVVSIVSLALLHLSHNLVKFVRMNSIYYLLIYFGLHEIIIIFTILLFKKLEGGYVNRDVLGLSFKLSKQAKQFLLIFTILGVSVIVLLFFLKASGASFGSLIKFPTQHSWKLAQAFSQNDTPTILFYLIPHVFFLLITTPVLEEVLFTGIIYPTLRNKFGIIVSLLCSGLVFTLCHDNINVFMGSIQTLRFFLLLYTEILSFLLYQYTRSLYPSIAYHFFRNFLVMFVEISSYME